MDDAAARSSAHAGSKGATTASELPLTIGQVVAQLQPDFPDLSITKIRYLEDRKLLSPARSKGRYRKYSAADVRKLRTVLTLQRDEYLPLEVIRERIERAGSSGTGQSLASVVAPLRSNVSLRKEEAVFTWPQLLQQAGVDDGFSRILVEFRLIEPSAQSGAVFTESDAEVARICQVLARFGLEPRTLRLLSSSVEREAPMLEQVVAPSLRSTHPDKREHGEQVLGDLGALYSQLMHFLLYKELRKAL
jgi:DNA-binding transcriptional MerR regulator